MNSKQKEKSDHYKVSESIVADGIVGWLTKDNSVEFKKILSGHLEQVHVFLLLLGKYKTLNVSFVILGSCNLITKTGMQFKLEFKFSRSATMCRLNVKLPIVFTGQKAHFYADCQKIAHHENNTSSEHC